MSVLSFALSGQDAAVVSINLATPKIETTAKYAVWRTDYYICTGLAYAKSQGKSVQDFTNFVADRHTLDTFRNKGLASLVKFFNFFMKSYPGGKLEIIFSNVKSVQFRSNRPYRQYFNDGPILGVTLDEFESYLWGHLIIILKRIDIKMDNTIDSNYVTITLSLTSS
jgi:hypothetical protein